MRKEITITTYSDDCSSVYSGTAELSLSEYTDKIVIIRIGSETIRAKATYEDGWTFHLDLPGNALVEITEED